MTAGRTEFWTRPIFVCVAWGGWIVLILAVSVLVVRDPDARSVLPVYRLPALAWWRGQDIYPPGVPGFPYLPLSAILFTPFALLGSPVGDLLWRWLFFALFTDSLIRLARLIMPSGPHRLVPLILLASIPAAAEAVRNGQATLPMDAFVIYATVCLGRGRWWGCAAMLAIAIAIKQWAVVPALLGAALYPRLRVRIALGVAVVLSLPFLTADPAYVVQQYEGTAHKMWIAGNPGPGPWSDVAMMLLKAGIDVPAAAMMAIRVLAAPAILMLAWLAVRRHAREPAALLLLCLATCYMLAFNPRAESNSYVMLAPLLALFGGLALETGERWLAAGLLAMCVALGSQGYGNIIFHATELWLKPLVCLLFLGFLVVSILRPTAARAWQDLPRHGAAPAQADAAQRFA